MLKNGEVDLMGNLSYTDERAESIAYGSYEQGKESYYLYANRNHNVIEISDYSTINGKRIGTSAGTAQEKLWIEWCADHSIDCEIVEYKDSSERKQALNSGEVDATIGGAVQQSEETVDWRVLLNFGSSPFYFGVNKNRPDLLAELDLAQKHILEENPFYNEEVHDRYMKSISLTTTNLDEEERAWLQKQDGQVRIGYLVGFQPLSYQDEEGNFTGVAADALKRMEEQYADYGLRFESIPYSDYATMIKAMKDGVITAAWPAYSDYWNADQSEIALTDRLMTTSMMVVFPGEYTADTFSKIGVIKTGSLPGIYAKIYYPDSETVEYNSYEDAVNAALKGEVGSVLYVTITHNVDIEKSDALRQLSAVILPKSFGISIAVAQQNRELVAILNKGLAVVGDEGVNQSLIQHSVVHREVTLKDYFEQHPLAVNIIIGAFLVLLATIIIFVVYKNMSVQVKASRAEKEVYERLSNSDVLTGLLNRRAYESRIREIVEHPEKYPNAVLMELDITGVKRANDRGGRPSGDKLIMSAADALTKCYGDDVYRISGNNFAVIDANNVYADQRGQRVVLEVFENEKSVMAQGLCALKKEDGTFRTEFEWRRDVDIALYNDKLENKAVSDYTEDEKLKAFIFGVSAIVDARDAYTAHHSERVKEMAVLIATKMGLSNASVTQVKEAAELHDIGKIGISDAVLQKPGRLTDEEFRVMKTHPVIGAGMLSKTTGLFETANIVRHHHERYDGKGYPDGIAGKDIPIESRIIAVADSIDAMTSTHCYRKALTSEVCFDEIRKNLGVMYDPAIGKIALDHWDEIMHIVRRNG